MILIYMIYLFIFISFTGKLGEKKLLIQQFGSSKEFVKSADHALDWKTNFPNDTSPSDLIEAAIQVTGCEYEGGTCWGQEVHKLNKITFQTFLSLQNLNCVN